MANYCFIDITKIEIQAFFLMSLPVGRKEIVLERCENSECQIVSCLPLKNLEVAEKNRKFVIIKYFNYE